MMIHHRRHSGTFSLDTTQSTVDHSNNFRLEKATHRARRNHHQGNINKSSINFPTLPTNPVVHMISLHALHIPHIYLNTQTQSDTQVPPCSARGRDVDLRRESNLQCSDGWQPAVTAGLNCRAEQYTEEIDLIRSTMICWSSSQSSISKHSHNTYDIHSAKQMRVKETIAARMIQAEKRF